MMKFEEEKNLRVKTMRKIEELMLQDQNVNNARKPHLQGKNREEFFARLHSEELKKLQQNQGQDSGKLLLSPTRTKEEIVQHLYTDFFIRDTKLKAL